MLLDAPARRGHAKRADVSSAVASGADIAPGVHGYDPTNPDDPSAPPAPDQLLTPSDVQALLQRAAAAADLNNAIIAVVDRNGTILGVRVESGVSPQITDNTTNLVFAIDGAVSLARTGAYFANDTAPLTSRTGPADQPDDDHRSARWTPTPTSPIPTATPRSMARASSRRWGSRGTSRRASCSRRRSTSTTSRAPTGTASATRPGRGSTSRPSTSRLRRRTWSPRSRTGVVTGILPTAQSRGIATLPGGVPLYKKQPNGTPSALVGGIGVFFPGTTGLRHRGELDPQHAARCATSTSRISRTSPSTWRSWRPAGASRPGCRSTARSTARRRCPNFTEPFGRIDLAGITLNIFGNGGLEGPSRMLAFGQKLGAGNPNDGTDMPVDPQGDTLPGRPGRALRLAGDAPRRPTADLTAADVEAIVARGIAEADQIRAADPAAVQQHGQDGLRRQRRERRYPGPLPDARCHVLLDPGGGRQGPQRRLLRQCQPAPAGRQDQRHPGRHGADGPDVPLPVLAALPRGDRHQPARPGLDPHRWRRDQVRTNKGAPLPAKDFQSLQGFADFNPNTNFQDPYNLANQSGVVFFPGSAPLYKDTNGGGATNQLVGGLGVSGDGVLQDDDVTSVASIAYAPPQTSSGPTMVKVRGVRLPFFKFNRNPHVPLGSETDSARTDRSMARRPLPRRG